MSAYSRPATLLGEYRTALHAAPTLRSVDGTGAPTASGITYEAFVRQAIWRMKHAGPTALDRLEPLLAVLRDLPELRERSRGTFYRGSRAFLHFHEDPAGLFADVRIDAEFERVRVSTTKERERLLRRVRAAV